MPNLILCKGLPASGKSTWSKAQVRKDGHSIRVCRDDLRLMLHDRAFHPPYEGRITDVRDLLIEHFMAQGFNIYVDETNIHPKAIPSFERMVKRWNTLNKNKHEYRIVVKEFNITVEEAIARDLKRPNSVGAAVIERMYRNFVQPPVKPIEVIEGLPTAVIFDMDGTLAHFNGRGPYEFEKCGTDLPDEYLCSLANAHFNNGMTVIIFSGRDDSCFNMTADWLDKHDVHYDFMVMRRTGDKRADTEIKEEMFNEHIRGKYNVIAVYDDRPSVCRTWRQMGLKVLQAGDPHIEF